MAIVSFFINPPKINAASVLDNDPSGTDIVCNPLQGIRSLYYHLGDLVYCSEEIPVIWNDIEAQEGHYNWTKLDGRLNKAIQTKKYFTITLGLAGLQHGQETPSWVFQAMQSEANQCCGGKVKLGNAAIPIPWNSVFRNKLKNTLTALNNHLNSYLDSRQAKYLFSAVNAHSGGPYGEMNLCSGGHPGSATYGYWDEWVNAGYSHQKFAQSVLDILDIYMGIFETPVAVQRGNGLLWCDPKPPGDQNLWPSVVVHKQGSSRYGIKLILKQNGFGISGTTPDQNLCQTHRCSAESAHRYNTWCKKIPGNEQSQCPSSGPTPEQYYKYFIFQGLVGGLDWYGPNRQQETGDNRANNPARDFFARHAGAQISNLKTEFPNQTAPGQSVQFSFLWFNRGNLPLYKIKNQGKKGVQASYKIFVDLVNDSGQTTFHTAFTPNPATQNWPLLHGRNFRYPPKINPNNQEAQQAISQSINLPSNIPNGNYKVYIGLSEPDSDEIRWKLVNMPQGSHDDQGRYRVGQITIGSDVPITPQPTSSVNCPRGEFGNLDCDQGSKIDSTDLTILLENWTTTGPAPTPRTGERSADLDTDNLVDSTDLTILLENWKN